MEDIHPSACKRKKRRGKKEEYLSAFETTEVIEHNLEGISRYCADCYTKYKVLTKETLQNVSPGCLLHVKSGNSPVTI